MGIFCEILAYLTDIFDSYMMTMMGLFANFFINSYGGKGKGKGKTKGA